MRTAMRMAGMVTMMVALPAAAFANFVTNGDFSAGNTGFTSTATYKASGGMLYNEYSVRTNPTTANGGWCGGDHTTGTGNMLLIDSALNAVWKQTVVMQPGSYFFSAWIKNVLCPGTNIDDPMVSLRVNGVTVAGPMTFPESNYTWIQMSGPFIVTGAGPVTFEVWSHTATFNGSDFAVDDILVDGVVPVAESTWGKIKSLYR